MMICSPAAAIAAAGVLICRFGDALTYANAEVFVSQVLSIVRNAPTTPRWVVVRFDSMGDVDSFAAKSLTDLFVRMEAQGVTLVLADLSKEVEEFLAEFGVPAAFGTETIFRSIDAAVAAYHGLRAHAQYFSVTRD